MSPPTESPRRLALLPRTARGRIALAWASAVLGIAVVTAPAVGISRDESVYLEAAASYVRFWREAARFPSQAAALADRHYAVNHEHPGLAKLVFGVTHAVLADGLGVTRHLQGFRFGAFLFAALLAAILALWGFDLSGVWGGALAPALFFLVPRHFYHAHPAVLDLPVTAAWLATAYAFWRSLRARGDAGPYLRWSAASGLLLGAAVATKHTAWFLPPLLLAAWLLASLGELRRDPLRTLRGLPLALPAMAFLGPLVLLTAWPWLWHETLPRLRGYLAFHLHHENYPWLYLGRLLREPPFPVSYPFVVTALTVPGPVLAAMVGGLAHSVARAAAALRGRATGVSLDTELILSLNALFPIALIAWPTVPIFGGVKHWLPAMPFLALLGARALVTAARLLAPARPGLVTGALAALALAPAAWRVARVHPFGTAAWNELAGGAAGAASLGMQRQFWGDNMVAVLPEMNEHAVPGARVWFQEATWLAVRQYQRDGRLRADLRWANGPEEADVSVWHHHQEFRDKEYRTWTELGTARPVAGAYLDEVPLVLVYARPGAWR